MHLVRVKLEEKEIKIKQIKKVKKINIKIKEIKLKKGGKGDIQYEIKNADEENFNGIYKKVDVNQLSENLRDNEFIQDFITTNTENGIRSFGITGQEGTFFVKEDNHQIIIYHFNFDDPGTWFIQNLENGVEDQFTYYNGNISVSNAEGLPNQGWIKNGGRSRDIEVPNLEVVEN